MKVVLAAAGLLTVFALPANAQQVKLQISDGRVTLDAVNASARQILAEWARIGGTNVVGADKITGAGLTLKLVDMPERQALDIILRNVAGFMAAARTPGTSGASTYDRILVMATSANAAQAASSSRPGLPGNNANILNGTQRRVIGGPPRPPNLPPAPADGDDEQDDQDANEINTNAAQPVFSFPNPQGQAPGANNPVFVPMQSPNANGGQPVINLQPGPNGPTIYNFVPNGQTTPAAGAPNAPFSVIGSPTPGMIQAPPPAPGTQKPPPR
jgi:hypothetical protein